MEDLEEHEVTAAITAATAQVRNCKACRGQHRTHTCRAQAMKQKAAEAAAKQKAAAPKQKAAAPKQKAAAPIQKAATPIQKSADQQAHGSAQQNHSRNTVESVLNTASLVEQDAATYKAAAIEKAVDAVEAAVGLSNIAIDPEPANGNANCQWQCINTRFDTARTLLQQGVNARSRTLLEPYFDAFVTEEIDEVQFASHRNTARQQANDESPLMAQCEMVKNEIDLWAVTQEAEREAAKVVDTAVCALEAAVRPSNIPIDSQSANGNASAQEDLINTRFDTARTLLQQGINARSRTLLEPYFDAFVTEEIDEVQFASHRNTARQQANDESPLTEAS